MADGSTAVTLCEGDVDVDVDVDDAVGMWMSPDATTASKQESRAGVRGLRQMTRYHSHPRPRWVHVLSLLLSLVSAILSSIPLHNSFYRL